MKKLTKEEMKEAVGLAAAWMKPSVEFTASPSFMKLSRALFQLADENAALLEQSKLYEIQIESDASVIQGLMADNEKVERENAALAERLDAAEEVIRRKDVVLKIADSFTTATGTVDWTNYEEYMASSIDSILAEHEAERERADKTVKEKS